MNSNDSAEMALARVNNTAWLGVSCAGLFFLSCLSGIAASFLQFETSSLQPNTTGQTVTLYLANQGPIPLAIGGLDLALQIGNGLPDPGAFLRKPAITSVDLLAGTLFEGYATRAISDSGNQPFRQFWSVTIPLLGGFPEIPAHAQLPIATIAFDTTGLFGGEFSLAFTGSLAGDTVVFDSFGFPLLDNTVADARLTVGSPAGAPDNLASSTFLFAAAGILIAIARWCGIKQGSSYNNVP